MPVSHEFRCRECFLGGDFGPVAQAFRPEALPKSLASPFHRNEARAFMPASFDRMQTRGFRAAATLQKLTRIVNDERNEHEQPKQANRHQIHSSHHPR